MLTSIIRLEYILNKVIVWIAFAMVLGMALAYALLFSEDPGAAFTLGIVYLSMLPVMLYTRQSKFRAEATICALPVSRPMLMLGKQLFVTTVGFASFAAMLLLLIALPIRGFTVRILLAPDRLVNALFVVAAVGALLTPLVLRFGYMGVMIFMLVLNVASVILVVLTSTGGITGALDFFFHNIPEAFRTMRRDLGVPGYHIVMLAASGLCALATYGLSTLIYAKKEL